MKTILRYIALFVAIAALTIWVAKGANQGWTKTSIPVKEVDEITGIEVDRYESRFIPGVDFLGGALAGAGILFGASFLFRKQKNNKTEE